MEFLMEMPYSCGHMMLHHTQSLVDLKLASQNVLVTEIPRIFFFPFIKSKSSKDSKIKFSLSQFPQCFVAIKNHNLGF